MHVSVGIHRYRQYVDSPCTEASQSTGRYHYAELVGYESWLFNDGSCGFAPIDMAAGQSVEVIAEIDWSRNYMQKDYAVTAWGESAPV